MKENLFLSEMHEPKPEYFSHGNCVHGYKALHMDNTARNNYKFQSNKVYIMNDKPKLCLKGYHFCRNLRDIFNYHYFKEECRIYHVIAFGDIVESDNKCATNKIYIGDEIPLDIVFKQFNIGENNIGFDNVGDFNCGFGNKGNYNCGNYNFGDFNLGHGNKGFFNIANNCVGSFNIVSGAIGFFNTKDSNSYNFTMFDKPIAESKDEINKQIRVGLVFIQEVMFERNIDIFKNSLYKKPLFNFSYLSERHKKILLPRIKSLPNFNPDIFYRCTGIILKKG